VANRRTGTGHVPTKGSPRKDKTVVMSLVSRETGEVRSQVISNVKASTLRSVLFEHTDRDATHLQTDQLWGYRPVGRAFAQHSVVNHEAKEYVRDDVTTNQAEKYFSQLKRSLDGTHHHVSVEHLDRYLAHFDFLYSTCKESDSERMEQIIARTGGRRLMYSEPARA